jgi:hypothetical protein
MKTFLGAVLALLSMAVTAATSSAAPAQRFPLPDLSLASPNACTGNVTTVTLSDRVLVIHDDVDPNGREHLSATITGDIATADGFAGRFTTTFGQNNLGDPLIVGEFRGFLGLTNSTFTLHNGSGALVLLHGVSHVTVPAGRTGNLTGEVDIFKAECLGRPT